MKPKFKQNDILVMKDSENVVPTIIGGVINRENQTIYYYMGLNDLPQDWVEEHMRLATEAEIAIYG